MPKTHKVARSPFLGHRVSSPQPSRRAVESPLPALESVTNVTPGSERQVRELSFVLTNDTPTPRHKPKRSPQPKRKRQVKTIQNPPAVGAGVVAFFDGAFDRGRAAFGAVVYREGQRIHRAAGRVNAGLQLSCNVAEYAGAINVLRFFQREGITQGSIYGDSMLVVKQLNGAWKAKAGAYLPFYHEAIKLRRELPDVRLIWTNRENNTEGDELSKQPLL